MLVSNVVSAAAARGWRQMPRQQRVWYVLTLPALYWVTLCWV